MDIPENQTRENMTPLQSAFQDRRSRGLGGLPLATCAEENLLNLRGDPYTIENITIHEFSHTVASAIRRTNSAWYRSLHWTYEQAMNEGLFAHSYSATNEQEYWAEGAQAWFDCAAQRKDPKVHSGIWNRDQLRSYDPRLAALLQGVFGDGAWRYVKSINLPVTVDGKTYTRPAEELDHLAGIDRTLYPVFRFNNSPRIAGALRATSSPSQ
jgi:alpha-glucosidase